MPPGNLSQIYFENESEIFIRKFLTVNIEEFWEIFCKIFSQRRMLFFISA